MILRFIYIFNYLRLFSDEDNIFYNILIKNKILYKRKKFDNKKIFY